MLKGLLSHSPSLLSLAMAAELTLEAHGKLLRLAAPVGGLHFQGLGALAASLRRAGCPSKRLLRRLSQLDDAAGVLRHITVVSVKELELELEQALAFLKPQVEQVLVEPQPDVIDHSLMVDVQAYQQREAPVVNDIEQGQSSEQGGDTSVTELAFQQRAAFAKWKLKMADRLAAQVAHPDLPEDPAAALLPDRLGGRAPNLPVRE